MAVTVHSLQSHVYLSGEVCLAQTHFDEEGALRAAVIMATSAVGTPEEWAEFGAHLFASTVAAFPRLRFLAAYGVHLLRRPGSYVYSLSPISPLTQAPSLPLATVHPMDVEGGWDIRLAVRRPGTLDVVAVAAISLDPHGGVLSRVVD